MKRGRPKKINKTVEKPVNGVNTAPNPVESDEMTEKQMNNYLLELEGMIYWQALLKFIYRREQFIVDSLFIKDPFQAPTEVARLQGNRTGMFDIISHIDALKAIRQAEVDATSSNSM